MTSARAFFDTLLKNADIVIGGARPQDIVVHDERLFARVVRHGSLGLGEAYMDGWWDAGAVDQFMEKVIRGRLPDRVTKNLSLAWFLVRTMLTNRQSKARAFQVGEAHYDLGNDLYEAMLDHALVYTCGYWSSPTTPAKDLDDAQVQKLDLVCRKIGLKAGDRVLDIGCGWGSFAKFAAERYGAEVVGITISKEQAALGRENCTGLHVEIRVQDYRDVDEPFDHIVSLGMFEHVGVKNYREYFEVARRCLADDGLFLLHTIGGNISVHAGDPWVDKYIFPNGMLPSVAQIGRAVEGLFVMEDWHNFGADYDKTLMAWFSNFDAAWPALRAKYASPGEDAAHQGDRFYRMWKYYLLAFAGVFRARDLSLWQIVLSKDGVPGGYRSVR